MTVVPTVGTTWVRLPKLGNDFDCGKTGNRSACDLSNDRGDLVVNPEKPQTFIRSRCKRFPECIPTKAGPKRRNLAADSKTEASACPRNVLGTHCRVRCAANMRQLKIPTPADKEIGPVVT